MKVSNTKPIPLILCDFVNLSIYLNFCSANAEHVIFDYDIAILELSEEVDLNIYTPACLAKKGDNFTGQTATAAGWGFLDKEETISTDVPHEVQARVADCGPGNELIECMEKVNGKEITRVRTYKHKLREKPSKIRAENSTPPLS